MRKLLFTASALAFFFLNCKKDPEILKVRNLSDGQVGVFGHGGMGIRSLLPIDSKESLTKTMEVGADGTEMDVQMSADSVLFLFHAPDLSENTGCQGSIRTKQSEELECFYKSLKPGTFKICRLEDFLSSLTDTNFILTLECKPYAIETKDYPLYVRTLTRSLTKHNLQMRAFIESTSVDLLLQIRQVLPAAKLFLYSEQIEETILLADTLNFFGVTFDMNRVSAAIVAKAHEKNLRVTLFNQQSKSDNIRCLQMNPDFMQTDQLEHLLELTGKK